MGNTTDHSDVPLAIIGMACKLPEAESLDAYWRLISEGRSAVGEVPADRLNREIYYDPQKNVRGKTYSTKAALLKDRTFRRDQCPLPDELVNYVDSTHLLMTQVAAEAFRHAGYDPFNLSNRNASVFIGHAQGSSLPYELSFQTYLEDTIKMLSDVPDLNNLPQDQQLEIQRTLFQKLHQDAPNEVEKTRFLGCNMVAGTIAKAFNLTGSWMALNSACSSSLLAMMMGARALQRGHTDMVVVGGASEFKGDSLILFSNAQTLTKDDSRPFDSEADGLVISEGYVSLVMKTLEKALADGDPIQAVVRGLGVATDGRGKSLWAPLKDGQARAMKRAYRSGLDISKLQYIESHATATQLGDATELESIEELLKPAFAAGKKIPVTSVKANIGHALEAAGIAGMIKTVLCMQNQIIPKAINIRQLNTKVDWDNVPFYIPQESSKWVRPADGGPRMAGVNAFGIGGLNMHVVVEEFTTESKRLLEKKRDQPETEDDRAIAIIGMGCISPAGSDINSFYKTLLSGADPKSKIPKDRWPEAYQRRTESQGKQLSGGFITDYQYDWRKHKVPPKQVQQADPLQFMFLDASEQALADAGYNKETIERELCGVVIGTEFGGDFADQLEMGLRLQEIQYELTKILSNKGLSPAQTAQMSNKYGDAILKKWPALIDESGSFTSSTLASRISKTLDLKGGAVAIDCGATSGLSALAVCVDTLLSGDNDMMICAAGQRSMGPTAFKDLEASGVLSKQQTPFSILDSAYDGIQPSEGVGVVVLKRLADAKRDGDPIRAVIRGIGVGSHESAAEAMQLAMHKASSHASINLEEVELLNLDTDENDFVSQTLSSIISSHTKSQRQNALQVSSATSQLGHAGGASSLFALIKTCMELQNAQVSGAFNLHQTNTSLTANTETLQVTPSSSPLTGRGLGAVASWSKGQAFYVMLDDGKPVPPKNPSLRLNNTIEQPQIIRFGAASYEQLSEQLVAAIGKENSLWNDAKLKLFQPEDKVRLAVVASDPETLAKKLNLARTQFNNPKSQLVLMQQGIFCRETLINSPRVAFLFPGQGSQYEGMLRELIQQSPAAFKAVSEADQAMNQLGYPTFAELAWNSPTQLGKDIWTTQISMLLADKICLDALHEQGVAPDLVLGHSYGEFAALLAAEVWDLKTAIRMTKARCNGIDTISLKNAGLLATNAPPEEIKSIIQTSGYRVYLANFNAPDQTVVGGKTTELEQLVHALSQRSYPARILAVPAAFHTPLMAGSSRMLEQALQTIDLRSPKIPLISTVDNQLIEDPAKIKKNLGVQLTTPVRYAPLIEQLALETPTLFVEVGPQQTLTKLNRRILSPTATVIASDNPKSGGLEQILCVKALLECLGEKEQSSPEVQILQTRTSITTPTMMNSSNIVKPSQKKELSPMDDIVHFDATERRREKMRTASEIQPPKASSNGHVTNVPAAVAKKSTPRPASEVPVQQPVVPTPAPTTRVTPPVEEPKEMTSAITSPKELESFLINFVVEQTGYPPEVVELDADLEADLGIDSIKKAQLFGELQEYFEINTTASNISLDDFPTLRHVLNFLSANGQSTSSTTTSIAAAQFVESSTERSFDPVAVTAPSQAPDGDTSLSTSPEELESFLINFVVEQTGYPPEVVELDADLEADLGIDSIKKAQLFGELQEYFEINTSTTNISLDDFPTLRHVMNFLSANGQASSSNTVSVGSVEQPVPVPPLKSSTTNHSLASLEVPQLVSTSESVISGAASTDELESFLINFVVEQTGYPPEVVELDADLEADLGIDSIKKAQLFGELQEYFEINTSAKNISLDDFPTLRHVLNFLAENGQAHSEVESPPDTEKASFSLAAPAPAMELNNPQQASVANSHSTVLKTDANSILSDSSTRVLQKSDSVAQDHVEISGTPYELGWQHGQRFQSEIQKALRTYVDYLGNSLDELPGSENCLMAQQILSADELDELQGIADAVQASLGNILAHHFAASTVLGEEAVHTVSSDQLLQQLHIATSTLKPLVHLLNCELFLRTPASGIPHVAAVPLGTTHTLGGINACGIGITTVRDSRILPAESSTTISTLSRSVLSQATSIESAIEIIKQVSNPSPFHSRLNDSNNRIVDFVFDGQNFEVNSEIRSNKNSSLKEDAPTIEETLTFSIDYVSQKVSLKSPVNNETKHSSYNYSKILGAPDRYKTQQQDSPHIHPEISQPGITARFELEMRDTPLAASLPTVPTWTGSAIILGTDTTSDELKARFKTDGINLFQLDLSDDLESLKDQVSQISKLGPVHHLFITSGRQIFQPTSKDDLFWSDEILDQVEKAFFVCQQFISIAEQGDWLHQCTIVLCTGLGGDFGFTYGASNPASGALSGLMKAIFIEFTVMREGVGPRVKIIDSTVTENPVNIVNHIFNEIASGNLDYEVSWDQGRRQVPFAVERGLQTPTQHLDPSGVWIATGGARGITAACALELGKRYGIKLHLIGTMPIQDFDPNWRNLSDEGLQKLKVSTMIAAKQAGTSAPVAWQNLQRMIEIDRSLQVFAEANVNATYHACDISDRVALANVLSCIRNQDGPITGVLHGAGIEKSCRFGKKQAAAVRQTLGAKVDGAANLVILTQRDPIRHFISFGSIAGRFGSFGQADYCLSSDFVCKLMGGYRRQRPWIKFTGFHWHPWGEVGMAARPETQSILQSKSDLNLLPLAEGIGHLIREIEAGLPQPEVMITERRHWQRFADGQGKLVESRKNHTVASSPVNNHNAPFDSKTAEPKIVKNTMGEGVKQDEVELKTTRCELRLLSAPLPSDSESSLEFDTPVWIYGDNALAKELHDRLETGGVEVYRFKNVDDLDFTIKQLESLHPEIPCKYLFLLSGSDPIPLDCLSESEINQRRHKGIIAPYFISQYWYQRLLKNPPSGMASLSATVSLGGDFGFEGKVGLPESGGISGTLKSIHIEDTRSGANIARCKVIDFDATDTPNNMVDSIFKELAADQPEVEVSWAKQKRRVVRPIPTPLVPASFDNIPRNGVWVVTGGARGITSISARELAKRYGWKLHLLGKSPAPAKDAIWRNYDEQQLKTLKVKMARQAVAEGKSPAVAWDLVLKDREIFENLNQFTEEGISATYHSCDVTNRPELASVLDTIRQSGDSINGIMYGAGITDPGRFEHKRRPFVEKLVRTKFDGLMHLLALTQNDPLTHCIGFGSISGRFGGNGSSDYAAGNDSMSKVIGWIRTVRPECTSFCIDWESWDGSGMATLPRYAWGSKSVMKMKYMTPEEGVRRLEQELAAGGVKAETLYTFGDFYPMFYPDEQQPLGEFNAKLSSSPKTTEYPLVISTQSDTDGFRADFALDPVADPFLAQHRLRDKPLLPTVVMLEALHEAASIATGKTVVGYQNIEMLEGLMFHSEKPTTAQVQISETSSPIIDCALTHDFCNRSGGLIQKDRLYLKAKVELAVDPQPVVVELPEMPDQWHELEFPNDSLIFHGAPFRSLIAIQCNLSGGWGKLSTLPLEDLVGQERAKHWQVPSQVLDSALYACGCHLWLNSNKAIALPRLIDHLMLGRMPRTGEICYVYLQCKEITEESANYDFTLVGDNGDMIVQVTGYHKVILAREDP